MKGNRKVIAALNAALRDELMAINQYFLHAEMLENWKYTRLSKYIKKQSIDEMRHAEGLIERILFLDGTPNLTEPMKLEVGLDVRHQLERQLQLEVDAVASYNKSIAVCRAEGDNASGNSSRRCSMTKRVMWTGSKLNFIKSRSWAMSGICRNKSRKRSCRSSTCRTSE